MACCIFMAWVIRTLVIAPIRALLGSDTSKRDAYATAPQGIRWGTARRQRLGIPASHADTHAPDHSHTPTAPTVSMRV